jgi:ABC-2 type transport system permease protein
MSAEFFKTTPVINFERFDEKKEKSGFVALASIFGHLIGFLIYIALNLYGVMIMRGVMEEKNSRIVEVLVSSVKPWQLMIGKISGVGLVGLTQFFMWGVTMIVGGLLFAPLMGLLAPSMPMSDMSSAANAVDQSQITELLNELKDFDFKTILLGSFFYFVGGYFLYGALFAAIGAAGVDESNAQSLTFPIVAPIILAIFLMMRAMNDPEGSIAFWGSIIPFTSPIVMPSLLPFSPPLWQIGLSLSILLLTILFTSYIAGKIYRTGILMQGKKISFKEMGKWLFS